MVKLASYLILAIVARLIHSVPLHETTSEMSDRQNKLEQLRQDFQGIFWDFAADPNECTNDEFNILAEATRTAIYDVMSLAFD